jgi:glutamyl-tRNA synthetase
MTLIILRSDGSPTYMLAVVVDDHDMGVTHVIRGVDHLTNAARQTQIFDAMGWDVPVMAHIPLIHGARTVPNFPSATGRSASRPTGHGLSAEAMRNYLARLGWSHGDDEIMSTDQT